MAPTVGRIVHYVMPNGGHRAALITRVHGTSCVNLAVFPDGDGEADAPQIRKTSVTFREEHCEGRAEGANTWHWPERVND